MVRAGQQIETQNVAVIVIAHSIGRRQITVVDQGNVPVIIGRPFFGAIPYRISLDRSDGTFLGYVLVIELSFEIGPEGIAVFVRRIHDDRVPSPSRLTSTVPDSRKIIDRSASKSS